MSSIVAFEPNSEGFDWLQFNLGRLNIPAQAMRAAVADFNGTVAGAESGGDRFDNSNCGLLVFLLRLLREADIHPEVRAANLEWI